MKFKSFEWENCEHYSLNIPYFKKEIEIRTKEGIEYSKVLSSGVSNGKPIDPKAIPLLKKDMEMLKKYIESTKQQLDDMLWDVSHVICEKDGFCGQYNNTHNSCGHDKFVVVKCREGYYHWGKEICLNCGNMQRWVPFKEGRETYGKCEFK
tara:strand:- start:31 stop:483 length:453 start_codon:yes stop_codon:yes gene_type:complete